MTARDLYAVYLARAPRLAALREYAHRVARATSGPGMTPVLPLATMGPGGGPLLCDHCRKPVPLEGGAYNNVPAHVAWARNPTRSPEWKSWIKGGVVIQIVSNGTLRVYHGYPSNPRDCCSVAARALDAAEAAHVRPSVTANDILAFLRGEFPERSVPDLLPLVTDIIDVAAAFDPGDGVNVPDGGTDEPEGAR